MGIFRKRVTRSQHPDPATELKLCNIAAIDGLRGTAMRQIASYQADLTDAQQDLGRATGAMTSGVSGISIGVIERTAAARIARAEAGIARQREVILSLNDQVRKAIAGAGLTEADLSYLNLEPKEKYRG